MTRVDGVPSSAGLVGLSSGIMIDCFLIDGIWLVDVERLKIEVRYAAPVHGDQCTLNVRLRSYLVPLP